MILELTRTRTAFPNGGGRLLRAQGRRFKGGKGDVLLDRID